MPKEKFFDPRKPFQSQRPETHEEWQARMGGEVLAVVRSGLYLDFRFLDMALSALTPAPDERCRVLATDGQTLYYQPQRLLQLYQENPKYLNRLYLHTVFHCVFRHLWLKGRREPQLWSLCVRYRGGKRHRQLTAQKRDASADLCAAERLPADHRRGKGGGGSPGVPLAHPSDARRAAAAGTGICHR